MLNMIKNGELGPLSFTYFIDSSILSDIFAPTRQLCYSQVFPFVPPIKHPTYFIATLFVSYIYKASPTQAFPSKQTNIPTSNSPQSLSLSLFIKLFSMEEMIKHQIVSNPFSSPQPLGIHRDSQTISKAKPKIRIIHIFAPEIIKTDVANFRELVQRLTGKPTEFGHRHKINKPRVSRREQHSSAASALSDKPMSTTPPPPPPKKMDRIKTGFRALDAKERSVKEGGGEEGMWNMNTGDQNSTAASGFLQRFADLEGFIQELGEFPLLPLDTTSHLHGYEGVQLV